MQLTIAIWQSRSKKNLVKLDRYLDGTDAYCYEMLEGHSVRGGGVLYAPSQAAAIKHIEMRIVPIAQPDANKLPMKRVL